MIEIDPRFGKITMGTEGQNEPHQSVSVDAFTAENFPLEFEKGLIRNLDKTEGNFYSTKELNKLILIDNRASYASRMIVLRISSCE